MFDFLTIAIYITSWWIIFAMALPIGVQPPENPEKGHAPSAPKMAHLKQKALWTSVIAVPVTWGLVSLY